MCSASYRNYVSLSFEVGSVSGDYVDHTPQNDEKYAEVIYKMLAFQLIQSLVTSVR